jgi:short-subunit dehydrogenase
MNSKEVDMKKKNKETALITGASSGIGKAIAEELAGRNYNLVLVARSEDNLEALSEQLEQLYKIKVHFLPLDLTEKDFLNTMSAFLSDNNLDIDILVNNAGFGQRGRIVDTQLDIHKSMIDLNIKALTTLSHHFARKMQKRRHGYILNVASLGAFGAGPMMGTYFATKAFVLSFTEALHEEMQPYKVHVSALCPGAVETEFAKTSSMSDTILFQMDTSQPEPVAKAGIDGLFRDEAIIIPGTNTKLATLGAKLAPRFLTRKLTKILQEVEIS